MKRKGMKTVGQMSGYIVARTGWECPGGGNQERKAGEEERG